MIYLSIYLSVCLSVYLSIYLSIHLSVKAELTPFPPTPFIIMWAPRNHTNIPLICLVVFPILAVSGRCVHTAMVKGGVVAQDCFGYEDLWRLMSWKNMSFHWKSLFFFIVLKPQKCLKTVMKGYEGLWGVVKGLRGVMKRYEELWGVLKGYEVLWV